MNKTKLIKTIFSYSLIIICFLLSCGNNQGNIKKNEEVIEQSQENEQKDISKYSCLTILQKKLNSRTLNCFNQNITKLESTFPTNAPFTFIVDSIYKINDSLFLSINKANTGVSTSMFALTTNCYSYHDFLLINEITDSDGGESIDSLVYGSTVDFLENKLTIIDTLMVLPNEWTIQNRKFRVNENGDFLVIK